MERVLGLKGGGEEHTIELSKDAIHGAGAASTAHADVEFVGVFCGHDCGSVCVVVRLGVLLLDAKDGGGCFQSSLFSRVAQRVIISVELFLKRRVSAWKPSD